MSGIPRNAEDCTNCRGSGWDRNAIESGYSGVCSDCSGQAALLPPRQRTVCLVPLCEGLSARDVLSLSEPKLVGCIATRELIYINRWNGAEYEIFPRLWDSP